MPLTVTRDVLGLEHVGLLQSQLVMLLALVAPDALNLGQICRGGERQPGRLWT